MRGALLLLGVLGCAPALPDLGTMPSFALTDEEGKAIGSAQLAGQVLVVDFIFTSCPDLCPTLTTQMSGLQATLPVHGVHLVTITVDPEHDTPAVLSAWADRFHADRDRWSFLTGDPAQVQATIAGFKQAAGKVAREGQPGAFDIVHSEKVVLVDKIGVIRGFYDADADGLKTLATDATALAG